MRVRRILFFTGLFLTILTLGTYIVLTSTGLTRSLVKEALSGIIKGRFSIQDAEMDPLEGQLRIRGLEVSEAKDDGRQVLSVPELIVDVEVNPFGDLGNVSTIRIEKAELDLYLGEKQALDFSQLLDLEGQGAGSGRIPAVEVNDLRVRLHLPTENGMVIDLSPIRLVARPDKSDSARQILRGECPNPLGGTIHIEGFAFPEKGEFHLLAKAEEFELRVEDWSKYGPEVQAVLEEWQVTGHLQPTVWLSYPNEEGALTGGLRAKARNASILPPVFHYKLDHLDGDLELSPENNGTIEILGRYTGTDIEKLNGTVRLENIVNEDEIRIRIHAEGVLIDDKMRAALVDLPIAARIEQGFGVKGGRADADIYLHLGVPEGDSEAQLQPRIQLDLEVHDVEASFEGLPGANGEAPDIRFPYPVTVEAGRIEVRDGYVLLPEKRALLCRSPTGARVKIHGEIDASHEDEKEHWMRLSIDGRDLAFDEPLRQGLAVLFHEESALAERKTLFDDFSPKGSADFILDLARGPDHPDLDWSCEIDPKGSAVTWKGFPFQVTGLVGRLDLTPERIDFHLAGQRKWSPDSIGRLEARGSLDLPAGASGADLASSQIEGEVRIQATDLQLCDELRQALKARIDPDLVDEQWENFSPEGTVDVDFLAWRSSTEQDFEFDLGLDFKDGQARFVKFQADIQKLEGKINLHGTRERSHLEIVGLKGLSLGGESLIHGVADFVTGMEKDKGLGVDMSVVARGIHVDEDLKEVLVHHGMLRESVWDMARPAGDIDVFQKILRKVGDADFETELILDLREMSSRAEILPDHLTRASGEVRIDNENVVHLSEVEAYIGKARLACREGAIRVGTDETSVALTLSAERFPVDERLSNLLMGDLKQTYLDRNLHGEVSFDDLAFTLTLPLIPPEDGSLGLEMWFTGRSQFQFHDISLNAGLDITGLEGTTTLESCHLGAQDTRFAGEFTGIRFTALGQDFSDGRGSWSANPTEFLLENDGVLRVHHGKIQGLPNKGPASEALPLLRYEMLPERTLHTNLSLQGLSLESLTQPLELAYDYRGSLDGTLELSTKIDDPTAVRLKSRLVLGGPKARLGSVPIFRSIYSMVRPERRPVFREAEIQLESGTKEIQIPYFFVGSPILEVRGRGNVTYDAYLTMEIDFPQLFPGAVLIPDLVQFLSNAFVQYDIYGYIGNTRTSPRFLLEGRPAKQHYRPKPGRLAPVSPIFN